jgi:hypothetical protein
MAVAPARSGSVLDIDDDHRNLSTMTFVIEKGKFVRPDWKENPLKIVGWVGDLPHD